MEEEMDTEVVKKKLIDENKEKWGINLYNLSREELLMIIEKLDRLLGFLLYRVLWDINDEDINEDIKFVEEELSKIREKIKEVKK